MAAQLVAEALSLGVQDDAAHAAQGLAPGRHVHVLGTERALGPGWCPALGRASAARNLILASASSGFTRPVGWTCTHSRSMVFAPISCQGCATDLAPLLAPATATHKPSRPATLAVHPRPGLAHLDAVARAVLPVGGGQVQQVGPVLGQQRVLGEVSAEAAYRTKNERK